MTKNVLLPDVNVLLYAFTRSATEHARYRRWLESVLCAEEPFGMSDLVLAAVVRIATNPRIISPPASIEEALEFCEVVHDRPNRVSIEPGQLHWEIFDRLCRSGAIRAGRVTDAYFAALAIESGCTWVTADRDYARFPGLQWQHPLL